MNTHFGSVMRGTLTGLLLALIWTGNFAHAQGEAQDPAAGASEITSNSFDSNGSADTATVSQPPQETAPSKIESSIFVSLFMAGKTQDQFKPFTSKERLKIYSEDLASPFHFFLAGVSAGITQAQNTPSAWGQGAEGYGRRFANYYASATVSNVLQMFGEDLLHEDNFYYGSGEHGIWRRMKYAVKSSVLARGRDGSQHFSISQVGSTAGAAFISRLWQPRTNDSAGDGAVSFGISMATNAGVNVIREFLPDVTRHVFHRTPKNQSLAETTGDPEHGAASFRPAQ
jgi:hypothetical protein